MKRTCYTADHEAFRASVRRFVDREIAPHIEAWEEAASFPRALYAKAAEVGLIGLGFPEAYGGIPGDAVFKIVATEELSRAGSGGIQAGLMSHSIGLPPIAALGTEELKARVLPAVLSGEAISALAITEPGGGSDVANLQTTAVRDGDHYIVNGDKTFITSGMRADFLTTAVRTGDRGFGGISILVIDGDSAGLSKRALSKMGWWCSDTAQLHFDDVRVPVANRVGPENGGFMGLMLNFNTERLLLAAQAWGLAKVCYDDAVAWCKQRETFGRPLLSRQVVRHKLVDMRTAILRTGALLHEVAAAIDRGEQPVAEVCMLKNDATSMLEQVAGEAVQLLGGMGYMRGTRVERIFRETKVISIGGGASEILKDLASKQLGW